jgi:NADH-quinone oxidoreductase E subunit
MLSEKTAESIMGISRRYPEPRSAMLPALYKAQEEFGWLSLEALDAVSETLNVPKAFVRGVSSFYALFRHEPSGRHQIRLCTNVSCMMHGAEDIMKALKEKYGLEPGGTTEDGRFSFHTLECLGGCDNSPSMLVDEDFHKNLTPSNMAEILENYS